MSLSAIQDNLVKTNLVQQTQSRGEDVQRTQQSAQVTSQAEHDRQADQVVLMTRAAEQNTINSEDQRERQEQERKKRRDGEGERDEDPPEESGQDHEGAMHRINIIV